MKGAIEIADEEFDLLKDPVYRPRRCNLRKQRISFFSGQLVLSKYMEYPWWPGTILDPTEEHFRILGVVQKHERIIEFLNDGNSYQRLPISSLRIYTLQKALKQYETAAKKYQKQLKGAIILANSELPFKVQYKSNYTQGHQPQSAKYKSALQSTTSSKRPEPNIIENNERDHSTPAKKQRTEPGANSLGTIDHTVMRDPENVQTNISDPKAPPPTLKTEDAIDVCLNFDDDSSIKKPLSVREVDSQNSPKRLRELSQKDAVFEKEKEIEENTETEVDKQGVFPICPIPPSKIQSNSTISQVEQTEACVKKCGSPENDTDQLYSRQENPGSGENLLHHQFAEERSHTMPQTNKDILEKKDKLDNSDNDEDLKSCQVLAKKKCRESNEPISVERENVELDNIVIFCFMACFSVFFMLS